MKCKGKHIFFFLFVLLAAAGLMTGKVRAAESFSPSLTPYQVYNLYGSEAVYNEQDDKITYVIRASTRGSGAATGYQRFGLRLYISGTSYYVDLRTGQKNGVSNSKYGTFTKQTVGLYYYYMMKADLHLQQLQQQEKVHIMTYI